MSAVRFGHDRRWLPICTMRLYFLAAAIWYLLLTSIWTLIQSQIEARLGRGAGGEKPPSLRERLLGLPNAPVEPSLVSGGR